MNKIVYLFLLSLGTALAQDQGEWNSPYAIQDGQTILERFETPEGFTVRTYPEGSFGDRLQKLRLKENCTKAIRSDGVCSPYNGCAIVNWPIKGQANRQCADTVIGLWIYYLLDNNTPDDQIVFNIPVTTYKTFERRVKVKGVVTTKKAHQYTGIIYIPFSLALWKQGKIVMQAIYREDESAIGKSAYSSTSEEGFISYIYDALGSTYISASMVQIPTDNVAGIQVGDALVLPRTGASFDGHVQIILSIADNDDLCVEDTNCNRIRVILGDGHLVRLSKTKQVGTEMTITGSPATGPWKTLTIVDGKIIEGKRSYELYRFKKPTKTSYIIERLPIKSAPLMIGKKEVLLPEVNRGRR